jgi:CheY-like chemotaxis protein
MAARGLADGPFVLLVDDHEPTLRKLEEILECAGYACVSSVCPTGALAFCHTRRPSLVVTDLVMPQLDGHGLALGLKQRYPTLPILLVTGEQLDHTRQAAFACTFAGVFTKPVDVEHFLHEIDLIVTRTPTPPPPR